MNCSLRLASFGLGVGLTALAAFGAPARAVDRSLGADVPKPVITGTPWTDAEITALDANLELALAGASALRGAHAGLYAIDARDGRVLYQRNPDDAFQPASTLKLVVGSAALDKLGPEFRFRTIAFTGGPVVGGVVNGYLMLRGSGDVLLDDAALAELPAALKRAGITAVHGVSFDEPYGLPRYLPGWSWDDLPWYYAAPISRLGLNDNQVTLHVAPGAAPGAPLAVTVTPWGNVCPPGYAACENQLGFVIVAAATTGSAGSENTLDVTRRIDAGYPDEVRLVGSLAADAKPENLSIAVPYPPRYAAFGARRALAAGGISVLPDTITEFSVRSASPAASPAPAPAPAPPFPLWSHDSEPLRDMLADLWLPSDNVLAEELLRALGASAPELQGTSAQGIAYEKTWLRGLGIDTEPLALEDGSGLSAYDRITPRALVTILKHDWDGPYRDVVLDDLPIAGVRGTLKSSFTGTAAEQRVFAKTGSLSHVSSLAGYVANAKHGAVIFAFPVDDWVGDAASLRALRARVLSELAER
ncbi:MAG TPA: D-alanyl-D-alanine carboxypeptidase/D-alanyl-D-alanine-endopeptidase [Candidatus Limnocylindrales bacterium]|nr:D-alanyl-D-alanine carboxypeptidase/D-alanyl-D-alanine-endopeptidase [Candidatus Limnocylindrales bacterium]